MGEAELRRSEGIYCLFGFIWQYRKIPACFMYPFISGGIMFILMTVTRAYAGFYIQHWRLLAFTSKLRK